MIILIPLFLLFRSIIIFTVPLFLTFISFVLTSLIFSDFYYQDILITILVVQLVLLFPIHILENVMGKYHQNEYERYSVFENYVETNEKIGGFPNLFGFICLIGGIIIWLMNYNSPEIKILMSIFGVIVFVVVFFIGSIIMLKLNESIAKFIRFLFGSESRYNKLWELKGTKIFMKDVTKYWRK